MDDPSTRSFVAMTAFVSARKLWICPVCKQFAGSQRLRSTPLCVWMYSLSVLQSAQHSIETVAAAVTLHEALVCARACDASAHTSAHTSSARGAHRIRGVGGALYAALQHLGVNREFAGKTLYLSAHNMGAESVRRRRSAAVLKSRGARGMLGRPPAFPRPDVAAPASLRPAASLRPDVAAPASLRPEIGAGLG